MKTSPITYRKFCLIVNKIKTFESCQFHSSITADAKQQYCRLFRPNSSFWSHWRPFTTPPPQIDYEEIAKPVISTLRNDRADDLAGSSINDKSHTNQCVQHIPVMVNEVLNALQPQDGQLIVDMTFGAGGHAREILNVAPNIRYIASDRDPLAINLAQKMAGEYREGTISPILSRFSNIASHLHQLGIKPGMVDAFLFDFGVSSMQFDTSNRGFSLIRDGPLDMRMDGGSDPNQITAADVVNTLDASDLEHILKKYGEERKSRDIAHAIVEARYAFGKFTRTRQLADVIQNVFNCDAFGHDKLSRHAHVATKTFQALRIFVNDELNEIHNGIQLARHYLRTNGRCVVISFHSLEDRIVKRHFHDLDMDEAANLSIHDHFRNSSLSFNIDDVKSEFLTKPWLPLSRKVLEPTEEECLKNPRGRSAKLRAAIKVESDGL
ncbi:unnamed protein product [Lymnaea stagnalis]|uniref:Uncharacterized protein n=1 Tax=Lymnaea stagnalis TaxID=6523 RepID=A0AAV2I2K6_LYMST